MKQLLYIGLVLLFVKAGHSQNLQEGFSYLEQGQYAKAQDFFSNAITQYPNNKTAQLCYGRAIGLNGNASAAQQIFSKLLKTYPQDFELELNYAESLLWNTQYTEAKTEYEQLVVRDSSSFAAVLGYANTLSNLKAYPQALDMVQKALTLLPGNPNALVSRKYMRLGQAALWVQETRYTEATALIQQNFTDFPNDQDSWLNLINIYLMQDAPDAAYEGYTHIENPVIRQMGFALVSYKEGKSKKALAFAKEALELSQKQTDTVIRQQATERYIQALCWNTQYKVADAQIAALIAAEGDALWILRLRATLELYRSQLTKSVTTYQQILAKDSTSFDGNLGIANAYRALGRQDLAAAYAQKTLTFYPGQKDALELLQTLKDERTPQVTSTAGRTSDNGGNEANIYDITVRFPLSRKLKSYFGYGYRTTTNDRTFMEATTQTARAGLDYQIKNNTVLHGKVQLIRADLPEDSYTGLEGEVSLSARPLPLHNLNLGYSRQLQNFNAALINESLFLNNFSINYNISTHKRLGWYTSYIHTQQTDGNGRNLVFTSLYYQLTKKPLIKTGLNYQYLSFINRVPQLYFSPKQYHATEVFVESSGTYGKFSYFVNTAIGVQFVEQAAGANAFRLDAKLNYQLNKQWQLGLYGKYSNIASATATGFEFMDFGVRLRWRLTKNQK